MRYAGRPLAIGALMAIVVWSLASFALAAQETKTITGTVKSVDVANLSLLITEDSTSQEFSFKVDATTVITKGDKTITMADIASGDKVDVTLEQGKTKTIKVK